MRHIDFGWPRAEEKLGLPQRNKPFQPPPGTSIQKPLSERYGQAAEKEAAGLGGSVVRLLVMILQMAPVMGPLLDPASGMCVDKAIRQRSCQNAGEHSLHACS